jgi:predicted RNA methylase
MLKVLSIDEAQRVRQFFEAAGYTKDNLMDRLGFIELPSARLRNLARLLDRTREPSCLNALLRWFWIGSPQEASAIEPWIPRWFSELCLECGLLCADGPSLVATATLVPVEGFFIASDHQTRAESDRVLGPNPTSWLLSRFSIDRPSRSTLDLGTGNGILALAVSGRSENVVATDLNARALSFAAFNSRLNGIENVEFLLGDAFEPVGQRCFDLIVSNPPFYITPNNDRLFCENPLELDLLCRQIAREAAKHLNEGGYFQMLCEWAQVRGQTWQERILEWFAGSGCDVWILLGHTKDPSEYAQLRIRENSANTQDDVGVYDSYMAYYRERGVEAIHNGLVAMRRRAGQNWTVIEDMQSTPNEPFGMLVRKTFEARDFLQTHQIDEQMLSVRPRLSPHARLEQVLEQSGSCWAPVSTTLHLVKGFPFSLGVQPLVAEFLGSCDGIHMLGELAEHVSTKTKAPLVLVQKECVAVVRKLIERGLVLW